MVALGGGTGIREARGVAGSEQLVREKKISSMSLKTLYQGAFVVDSSSVYVGKKEDGRLSWGRGRVVQRGRVGVHHAMTL